MPVVPFEVASLDSSLPGRLLGRNQPAPGAWSRVNSGALIVFQGSGPAAAGRPAAHRFSVEFGTPNVAAAFANWLWSELHGHEAGLRVAGEEVEIHHSAIKDALLAAAEGTVPAG